MSLSRFVGFEFDILFGCCQKEFEVEKLFVPLVRRFDEQEILELGPSLVVLHRSFIHEYFDRCLDYQARYYDFELCLGL